MPDSPHRPAFVGSHDDYTPFGGSGDTLKRKEVLGGSLRVFFGEEVTGEEMSPEEDGEMETSAETSRETSADVDQ